MMIGTEMAANPASMMGLRKLMRLTHHELAAWLRLSRSVPAKTGSAPASGAAAGAAPATEEGSKQPHRLVGSDAFDPTGEGAGRNTRGRVCSPKGASKTAADTGGR